MGRDKRRTALAAVVIASLAVAVGSRLLRRPPPAPPRPRPAAEVPHPIIPSEPVVRPAVAPCRGRDLHDLAGAIRRSVRKLSAAVAQGPAQGAPASCRAEDDSRRWSALVDLFAKDANACVARDSELDSQWNQVQSAVLALDGCVDCTHARAARSIACARMAQLLDDAERATP